MLGNRITMTTKIWPLFLRNSWNSREQRKIRQFALFHQWTEKLSNRIPFKYSSPFNSRTYPHSSHPYLTSLIYSFILPQMFMTSTCDRHCCKFWKYNTDQTCIVSVTKSSHSSKRQAKINIKHVRKAYQVSFIHIYELERK